jgi:lysophospholipase L1-like esterase
MLELGSLRTTRLVRWGLALVVLCAAGSSALIAAGTAAADGSKIWKVSSGSRYLALGDSVTFGYEESSVVPAPDYLNAASFAAYPEMLGAELHLKVTNAACPGETSSSLIDASARSLGCENAYRKNYPLHVSYKGSQLAYGVNFLRRHDDVRLVSLMIGANDLFLCQRSTKDACASPSEMNRVFAKISANTKRILSAIRNTAHYRGQIALVNYYSLNYASAVISSFSILLNRAMDSQAKRFHAVIANGFSEFRAASRHSGGSSCVAGLLTQLSAGGCGVHPSYVGQTLLAQALEKSIRLGTR